MALGSSDVTLRAWKISPKPTNFSREMQNIKF